MITCTRLLFATSLMTTGRTLATFPLIIAVQHVFFLFGSLRMTASAFLSGLSLCGRSISCRTGIAIVQSSAYCNCKCSRLFSSSSSSSSSSVELFNNDHSLLIDPMSMVNYTIPFPKSLSPSSAAEFLACPQSYFFQYLLGIKQPTNLALAKGTMCHAALQKLFDLPPLERTVDALKDLLRSTWKEKRNQSPYRELFLTTPKKKSFLTKTNDNDDNGDDGSQIRDLDAERKWGTEALELLNNYYEMEDPKSILPPNPYRREMWISTNLTVITPNGHSKEFDAQNPRGQFLVRGIIDRLDYIRLKDGQTALRIADYKTAKSPNFKYSKAMNEKIAEQNFWQLKIYALLLQQMMLSEDKATAVSNNTKGVRVLRLMYLTSDSGKAQYIDMDLGKTQEQRDSVLRNVHLDLSNIWVQICNLVKQQDAKAFQHCNREFCFCHRVRPHFIAGTLWDRNTSNNNDNSLF